MAVKVGQGTTTSALRSGVRRWKATATSRAAAPRPLLDRMRLLFLVIAELNVLGSLPAVLSAGGVARHTTALGPAALGYLAVAWPLGCRRGRFGWVAELADAAALFVVGIAAGEPIRILNLLYLGLYFRSLYGSSPRVALRAVLYAGGHFAAVAVTGHPSAGVLAPEVVSQAFGLPISAGVMSFLARLTRRHQEGARRDQVLLGAASDLLAATTEADAHRAASGPVVRWWAPATPTRWWSSRQRTLA